MPARSGIGQASINISWTDTQLTRKIIQWTQTIGANFADEFQKQIRLLVEQVIKITPPFSGDTKSPAAALRQGKAAITRDFSRIGFVPVTLKGKRKISVVFGRKIAQPVYVPTKENPKFADPDAIHKARLLSKHGGRVSRGGKQPSYVSKAKQTSLQTKLFAEIGRLASGWVGIARRLAVKTIPAWIDRHAAAGRGSYEVDFNPQQGRMSIQAVNHFPGTADKEAADTIRRIEFAKKYRLGALTRALKARARGLWR